MHLRNHSEFYKSSPPTRGYFQQELETNRMKRINTGSFTHKRAKSDIGQVLNIEETRCNTAASRSKRKFYLENSMWHREIYIIKDGICTRQEIQNGFKFKFSNFGLVKRQTQPKELNLLLETCAYKWSPLKKFIALFTVDGKPLKSLSEIDPYAKVAVVGQDLNFIGFKSSEFSLKELLSIIEETFILKDSEVFTKSPRKKGVLYSDTSIKENKAILLKFRKKVPPHKPIKILQKPLLQSYDKYKHIEKLKVKLGETSSMLNRSLHNLQHKRLRKLMKKFELSEGKLHKVYAQYKTLLLVSVGQNPAHDIKKGVNTSTLIQYLRKGEVKEDGIIETLVKTIDSGGKGYLNWEEFLKTMCIIHFGSLSQQIDMVFNMYDADLSGELSFDEIKTLCKKQLGGKNDNISEYLSESFAKVVFEMAGQSVNYCLNADELKNILQNKEKQSIIQMLCNFNQ